MKKLIPQLKKEHELILGMIREVTQLGLDSENGIKKLLQTKSLLLAHLSREDKELYPVLNDMSKSDAQLKQLMDKMTSDMVNLANKALDFFDKYTTAGDVDSNFVADVNLIFKQLKYRIETEEKSLYLAYERTILNQ